jgi:hypothetical protein
MQDMFTPSLSEDGEVQYGGKEGEKPNLAIFAVSKLIDGLAADIARRPFDSEEIRSAIEAM